MEVVPVLAQALVAADAHAIGHRIELVERLLLHHVAQPGREVALLVDPSGGVFHRKRAHALELLAEFGGSGEGDALIAQLFGQRLEELEDVALQGLEHAQGAELHEEAHHGLVGGLFGDPAGVGFGVEGIFVPRAVVEAIADVFRQSGVAQQEFEARVEGAVVEVVRALPAEGLFRALGEHAFEAHFGHQGADFVRIHQAGVAQHAGFDAEKALDLAREAAHFVLKALGRFDRREAVGVRFGEKFDAARAIELIEELKHFGGVLFEELNGRAREREGAFEVAAVAFGHFDQGVERGDVAAFGRFGDGALIFVVIVVVMVGADVEEAVALEVDILVYFEIEADGFHKEAGCLGGGWRQLESGWGHRRRGGGVASRRGPISGRAGGRSRRGCAGPLFPT